jgi:hypothetical protein
MWDQKNSSTQIPQLHSDTMALSKVWGQIAVSCNLRCAKREEVIEEGVIWTMR